MANDVKYKMSQAKYDALMDELNYLETVREKEVAEQIKEARSFGDLSENSEYDEAKTEQGKLYSKIAELRSQIEHAEIIEKVETTGSIVYGSCVTLLADDGEEETYKIVGSQEANPMQGMVSDDSPIGSALLGKLEGESIEIDAPAGKLHFSIVKVEN